MSVLDWHPMSTLPPESGWYMVFIKPPFKDDPGSVHLLKWESWRQSWASSGLGYSEPYVTHWAHRPEGPKGA